MPLPSHTALVEFSTSHLECLQTQIHFLKRAGATVDLFLASSARERASFLTGADRVHFMDVRNGLRGRWKTVTALRRALLDLQVHTVVFNTAEGNHVRDFCLIAPRGMHYAGLLHHLNKIEQSFTQRLISLRIRRYFVLMDYLLSSVPEDSRGRFTSVSTIFSPVAPCEGPAKPAGEFWVCIPGELEYRRRDYPGLAESLRRSRPDPSIRFILAGPASTPDGVRFAAMIREAGLDAQFVLFRDYVPQDLFSGYMAHSDVILPLTHPGVALYGHYRHFQVSGSFLQALSYSRPILLDNSWAGIPEFDEIALFYDPSNLVPTLNRLTGNDTELRAARERFAQSRRFSFPEQQKRYLDLLAASTL